MTLDQMRARAELIVALEAAPCGSPDLDARVALQLGWTCIDKCPGKLDEDFWIDPAGNHARLPPWTTDVGVALTLVPARLGWMWDVAKYPGESAAAYIGPRDSPCREFVVARTPPLAIVAAALKGMT